MKKYLVIFCFGIYTLPAHCGAAKWSSSNLQILYGTSYELGDATRTIMTFEHANGWAYGDNYLFVDITNPDRDGTKTKTSLYAEISPRFSFNSLSNNAFRVGPLKDALLATTFEFGQGVHNNLYGLGVDFAVPTFTVFSVNGYLRDDSNADSGKRGQITWVWKLPFNMASMSWMFEGFMDYAFDIDSTKPDTLMTAPRLLADVGRLFGAPEVLQVGVEYQVWRNKFMTSGVNESVSQVMVKWIW